MNDRRDGPRGPDSGNPASGSEPTDLGFGAVVTRARNFRLLNRDGTFNVERVGQRWWNTLASYHTLLTLSWPRFFVLVTGAYLGANAAFALGYILCGPGALTGSEDLPTFLRAFFFSIHTFATIGYGTIVPASIPAHFLVTLESLVAISGFSLATGLVFARFARPVADIRYSRVAVIAPYRGATALEFRVVNGRPNQLVQVQATVMVSRFEECDGQQQRRFYPLKLERETVTFFPLNWTIVHPIDSSSPLYGWDRARMLAAGAEIVVLISALDETFAQTVHNRSSYGAEEIMFGAKFKLMYVQRDGIMVLDYGLLSAVEKADLPA